MSKLLADLHTHSIGSVHAYDSIMDMRERSSLPYIAVTDHVYDYKNKVLNKNKNEYIENVSRFYHQYDVIAGAELDIDINVDRLGIQLDKLDILLLAYHGTCPFDLIKHIHLLISINQQS